MRVLDLAITIIILISLTTLAFSEGFSPEDIPAGIEEKSPETLSPKNNQQSALETKEDKGQTVTLLNYISTIKGFRFSDQKRPFVFEERYDFDVWGHPDRLEFRSGTAVVLDLGDIDYNSLNKVHKNNFQGEAKVYKNHVYIFKCANGKYVKLQVLEIESPPPPGKLKEGEEFFPSIVFQWDYIK